MTDNTVEEFVVTAKKQDGFLNLGNNMYGYWGERGGSAGSGSSGQSVFTITVSISDPAHKADVEAAAVNLAKEIAKLDPVIKGLNPNTVIQLFDGTTMTAGQLQTLWAHWQFNITDDSYGPNSAGAIVSDGHGGFIDNVSYSALEGPNSYASSNYSNSQGLNFFVLHELAHETAAGQASSLDWWHTFIEDTGSHSRDLYKSSWEFQMNERYDNTFALDMGHALGIDVSTVDPTFGYVT